MVLLKAFIMCLSSFTRIPLPNIWDEKARKYMIIMLPFVGLIIGGIWFGLGYAISLLKLPILIESLILVLIPFLLTGFIHFDGFIDVVDAIGSYKPKEQRIQILKDPHVGSFGIIGTVLLVLAFYIGFASRGEFNYLFLLFIPLVSRIGSCLSLTIFKKLNTSQYNEEEKKGFKVFKIIYFSILLLISLVVSYFVIGSYCVYLLIGIIAHLLSTLAVRINLGGVNGDSSGFSIMISKTLMILCCAIFQGGFPLWF